MRYAYFRKKIEKILDLKENLLNLMLMVWVLICKSTHFAFYKYSILSFARGFSELYDCKRWDYSAL